jgi:hypothetical protein
MTSFETASTYNPRVNGSAYDLMGMHPGLQGFGTSANPQQQNVSQIPFTGQQQAWQQQIPWTQPQQAFFQPQPFFQQPLFQQPFIQQQPFNQQPFIQGWAQPFQGALGFQPFIHPALAYQNPWQTQFAQTPYAGYGVQPQVPVVTTRSAELNIKLPVHRLIGRHPHEVQQYLMHAVLPVLLDGVIKRSLHPELGRTLSSDLRGECIAEIAI